MAGRASPFDPFWAGGPAAPPHYGAQAPQTPAPAGGMGGFSAMNSMGASPVASNYSPYQHVYTPQMPAFHGAVPV